MDPGPRLGHRRRDVAACAPGAPADPLKDEVVDQIVTGDLADELLAGLQAIDVTGLALVPEGFRHLFVFGEPPDSLEALSGTTVRAPTSETTYAFLKELGTVPSDLDADDARFLAGIEDGTVAAAESGFTVAPLLPVATTAIGNIALFPKVNTLVVNTAAFEALPDEQRDVLREAAARMVTWAIAEQPSTSEEAQVYCTNGGRVVERRDYRPVMEAAAQHVIAALEEDAVTQDLIARIHTLSTDAETDSTAAPCGEAPPEAGVVADGAESTTFPEVVYRTEVPPLRWSPPASIP